jgi:ribosomal protein S18 acetylase RimI-like enzyme
VTSAPRNALGFHAVRLRESRPEEDLLIARHLRRMWLDNGVAEDRIRVDWEARVGTFIASARRELAYRAFLAETDDSEIVGSAGCQLFAGLYPDILAVEQRRYGYIWGVFVEPSHRGRGIAKWLTRATIEYLTAIGCTHALLHASPSGRPVYDGLGFQVTTNEMRLTLPNAGT